MKFDVRFTVVMTVLLLLSLGTRAELIYQHYPGFPPGWGGEMRAVAQSLASGAGFSSPYLAPTGPTALVPPVYPALFALLFAYFGPGSTSAGVAALGLNLILSALVTLPLFALTGRLFSRPAAYLAALAWALQPLLGYSDALFLWNTSLYTLLLTGFLLLTLAVERVTAAAAWLAYGTLISFLIVVEPIALTAVGAAAIWLVFQRASLQRLLVALAIGALLPAAWMARNVLVFDQWVFIRSGFGLELSKGVLNNDLAGETGRYLPNRNPLELAKYRRQGELAYIQGRLNGALASIRENPGAYGRKIVKRIPAFWVGYRENPGVFLFYGRFLSLKKTLFGLLGIGAFFSFFFTRTKESRLLLAILIFYPLVFYLTHIELRQRLPLEPLLLALNAGLGWHLFDRWIRPKVRQPVPLTEYPRT